MNNQNQTQNLNKSISLDNSDDQLQIGIKIILNSFENKINFFEKEISILTENCKLKDQRITELENFIENLNEDFKNCQEFNSNLVQENKQLKEYNEKLSDDFSKLVKFKNSILSSLHFDSNFILNANQEIEMNSVSNKDQNDYVNYKENNKNNKNRKMNSHHFNSKSNLSEISPLNKMRTNRKIYNILNDNLESEEEGNNLNKMISNLHNKVKTNKNITDLKKSQREKLNNLNSNDFNNNLNLTSNQGRIKTETSYTNLNTVGNNDIDRKMNDLKFRLKTKKLEKYNNNMEYLTTINTNNSPVSYKKEKITSLNDQRERNTKSNKYKDSSKFFNEARFVLTKEEFDELAFLIKSKNQNKISEEEFDSRITLLIGNYPILINDLESVLIS